MASVARARGADGEALLGIGQVLTLLNKDFSELSPSKLRFLEEQGLVTPSRTKSGYRKFSQGNIDRLRLVLTLQRDHYLPLRVISEFLDELDRGGNPEIPGTNRNAASILAPRRVLTRAELLQETGVTSSFLNEIVSARLLPPREVFPQQAVATVKRLSALADNGVTPPHLRGLRIAAERDAELIERALAARGPQPQAERTDQALGLAELLEGVRADVLRDRIHGS